MELIDRPDAPPPPAFAGELPNLAGLGPIPACGATVEDLVAALRAAPFYDDMRDLDWPLVVRRIASLRRFGPLWIAAVLDEIRLRNELLWRVAKHARLGRLEPDLDETLAETVGAALERLASLGWLARAGRRFAPIPTPGGTP